MSDQPLIKVEVPEVPQVPALPDPGQMLKAFIERGITAENVSAATKLMELYEHVQDRDAEKAFAVAFRDLQGDLKAVQASKPVPNNDGTVRYKFAPFEDIMQEVRPGLEKHGFTVSFSTDFSEGRMIKLCTIQHIGGHSKVNKFAVRIGKGPPGSTETQADGAASTYAKRYALCDALNIQIDHDVDAAAEGGSITQEQADNLRKWVADLKANEVAFLKFAGAASYEAIPAGKLQILEDFLAKKERLQKASAK